MSGGWIHAASDIVIGAMAGFAFGSSLRQRRINRDFLRLIFEHMGGDIIEIAASMSKVDPTLLLRLAERARRRVNGERR